MVRPITTHWQESLALGIGLMSRELAEYVVCVVGNAQGGMCGDDVRCVRG